MAERNINFGRPVKVSWRVANTDIRVGAKTIGFISRVVLDWPAGRARSYQAIVDGKQIARDHNLSNIKRRVREALGEY